MSRILAAVAVGISVTFGLLYLMQLLIDMGDSAYTDIPDFDLEIGIPRPTPVPDEREEPPPERPREPERAPSFTFSQEIENEPVEPLQYVPVSPGSNFAALEIDATADGPLVALLKVKPPYPIAALTGGIEGYVILQYDVRLSGAVDNVVVLESSNEVFDEAAVEAMSKFLYKPKMVGGISQETRGMKRMFQFEINRKRSRTPE